MKLRSTALGACLLTVSAYALPLILFRGTGEVAAASRDHRMHTATLPMADFERDWNNHASGTVLSTDGRELGGVLVRVYDAAAIAHALRETEAGEWPQPELQAETLTTREGWYELRDLGYGSKTLTFQRDGYVVHTVRNVVLADGLPGLANVLLEPVVERRLRFIEQARPAADVPVTLLPATWSEPPVHSRTAADGGLLLSPLAAGSEPLELLVGDPPVLVHASRDSTECEIPPEEVLSLRVPSGSLGKATVELFPQGAELTGYRKLQLPVEDGHIRLALRAGVYGILCTQAERVGWIRVEHDGPDVHTLHLGAAREVNIELEGAGTVHAYATWSPTRYERPSVVDFATTPLEQWEAIPGFRITGTIVSSTTLRLPGVPQADGWLSVAAVDHAQITCPLSTSETVVAVKPPRASGVSIRTDHPFLPVLFESGGEVLRRRSDSFGEVRSPVVSGPVVAWAGFMNGGRSFPQGTWVTEGEAEISFSRLDKRKSAAPCLFGFIATPDKTGPAVATVILADSTGRPVNSMETDEGGFYRFTNLKHEVYLLVVRSAGEGSARHTRTVTIDQGSPEDVRVDEVVWGGSVLLDTVALRDARCEILDNDSTPVWSGWINDESPERIDNLRPGTYSMKVFDREGQEVRSISDIRISNGQDGPVHCDLGTTDNS